jgi:hypothetical protein
MPSKSKSKGRNGKKNSNTTKAQKTTQVAAAAPVDENVAAPVEEVVTTTAKTQKAGKATKATKAKATKKVVQQSTETEQVTEAFTEVETATETQTTDGRRTRSFKVLLPNAQDYEGRFTGLTPYQAANKALSKYYRETAKPKKEIQFSIRESTRGSKRSTYTYNGRREKLKTPVEYEIKPKDGGEARTIVKNYKNRLTKVKKSELAQTNTA